MLHASCRKVMKRAAEWRGQKAGVMDALFYIYVTITWMLALNYMLSNIKETAKYLNVSSFTVPIYTS